jgi:hypothetical protein
MLPPILPQAEPPPPLLDFAKTKSRIDAVIGSWTTEFEGTLVRRKERYVDIDIEKLRQSGEIEEDATMIPDRIIDSNIQQDKADAMAFLNAGFRLAIFDCISNPGEDSRDLEIQFTKGLTYDGWYQEFANCYDAAALHKMGYIEVMLDPSKPLFVALEYIAFDKLVYNRKVGSLQQSEFIGRRYDVSTMVFESLAQKHGFDQTQVDYILNCYKDNKREEDITIWRFYTKIGGVVHMFWYSGIPQVQGWLKEPSPRRMGIIDIRTKQEVPLKEYPIFTQLYKPDENEVLVEHYGRGFLDSPQQEANTATITAFVNNLVRSSNYYASPENDDDSSAEMKQLEIKLVPGAVTNRALKFWSLPTPAPEILQAVTFFDGRNAASRGKTAFTVSNRKDSRKTAKELTLAEDSQQKITGTSMANYSVFLRSIFIFAWKIVQSQALMGSFPFLLVKVPDPNVPGQFAWQNDYARIAQTYDIRPAGDTDLVQAEAESQKMMQDWPVVQNTALAQTFLEDLLRLRYPRKATEYIQVLRAGNKGKELVGKLSQIIQGAIQNPQDIATLQPQDKQQVEGLLQQSQQFLQQP